MTKKPDPDDDTFLEYRAVVAPCVRILFGWHLPMADASALIGAWQRDGFRYTSTRLQLAWGVPVVALKDPASEAEAEAWYARHLGRGENRGENVDSP